MPKIKILIADNSFLIREAFRSIANSEKNFALVAEVGNAEDLAEKLLLYPPDVLVIDYTSLFFCVDDIAVITKEYPDIQILAITTPQPKNIISKALDAGVMSHLLKDCGKDEIIEAIYNTAKGQQFFCGKIIDNILKEKVIAEDGISCDGVKLSPREIEIIHLVAEGFSNKEIADKLFLSIHTITTHRKNIMSKLGINNTAGLVMFAIKNEIISPNKFLFSN